MEWSQTSGWGPTYQLNVGEPDEDGVLCTVRRVGDYYTWTVDDVERHHVIAHGRKGTLAKAMAAVEGVYRALPIV